MRKRYCEVCGKDITHLNPKRKRCEKRTCYNEGKRRLRKRSMGLRVCPCGKTFQPKNTRHRMCSPECAKTEKNKQKRARYANHLKVADKAPTMTWDRIPRKGDYSQKQYEAEQAALKKQNGWRCRKCQKELTGSNRFHCPICAAEVRRGGVRLDGDFIYDCGSQGYAWNQVAG